MLQRVTKAPHPHPMSGTARTREGARVAIDARSLAARLTLGPASEKLEFWGCCLGWCRKDAISLAAWSFCTNLWQFGRGVPGREGGGEGGTNDVLHNQRSCVSLATAMCGCDHGCWLMHPRCKLHACTTRNDCTGMATHTHTLPARAPPAPHRWTRHQSHRSG